MRKTHGQQRLCRVMFFPMRKSLESYQVISHNDFSKWFLKWKLMKTKTVFFLILISFIHGFVWACELSFVMLHLMCEYKPIITKLTSLIEVEADIHPNSRLRERIMKTYLYLTCMAKSLRQNFLSLILLLLPWHFPHRPPPLPPLLDPPPPPPPPPPGPPGPEGRDPVPPEPGPDGATSLEEGEGREGILMQGATGDRLCW